MARVNNKIRNNILDEAASTAADLNVLKPEEINDVKRHPTKDNHWGYHLCFDASECNDNIRNPKKIKAFIMQLVKELKMKLGAPFFIKKFGDDKMGGYSAIQLITTSTITFHGDNKNNAVFLDVFSCSPYNPKLVKPLFKKYFEPKNVGEKFFYRDAGIPASENDKRKSKKG